MKKIMIAILLVGVILFPLSGAAFEIDQAMVLTDDVLGTSHHWTGTQTFDDVAIYGGTVAGYATSSDLTTHTNPAAFTGVSDFALDSAVSEFVKDSITTATDDAAFTGTSNFALNSELTAHTDRTAFTGVSEFVTPNYTASHSNAGQTVYQVDNSSGVTLYALYGDGAHQVEIGRAHV